MHELCEYKIRHDYLHEPVEKPQSEKFYTEEVEEVTDVYVEFVIGLIEEMKRSGAAPLVLVEEKLNFSHVVPDSFGTGDMVLVGNTADGRGLIHVVDFKGGGGVFVSAGRNSQMMLYALGALRAYGYINDTELIRMSIVQPRLDNISTYECTADELRAWGESIKPIAEMAYRGEGEQKIGDWCVFCRAKPLCRARRDEAMDLARDEFLDLDSASQTQSTETTDATAPYNRDTSAPAFKAPSLVPFSELEDILPTLNRINSWIEAVFAYVTDKAINHGVSIRGYKVVAGRANREFTDTDAVIKAAKEDGFTDLYKTEMRSLADLERRMGKKRFAAVLGQFVTRPQGKLTLVPESDSRPAVDVSNGNGNNGADDFEALD